MQAVILAAGRGLRLRPLTETCPKALVDIGGKPLLERLFETLPEEIHEIIIVVGYLREQIEERFGHEWNGRPVKYVVQDPLDGTGSALTACRERLHDRFLVINGDDLYRNGDLSRLIGHPLGILASTTEEPVAASVLCDTQNRFEGLESNPPEGEEHLRVCGAYVLDERFFHYPLATIQVHDKTEYSLPHTLITMSRDCDIFVERAKAWLPVGTPEELEKARLWIK